MALYPVPWFTTGGVEGEGGAENYGELARADAFIGSSGATGVIDPTDFAVSALPTPGAAVRVVKGTGVIRSTYPGVVGQSYVVQERDHTDVPVEATGSSGAAKKYVYLLIEDTQYTGQPPESVEDGPYNSYHVTTTLPQFQPYLLLGEINQPKSTATITDDMITDRRELAMPRREQLMFGRPRVAEDESTTLGWSVADGGEYFPGGSGSPNSFNVFVPEWATRILIDASWMSVRYAGGANPHGLYWIEFGDEYRDHTWPGKQQREFRTQRFAFNSPGQSNNVSRTDWRLMTSQSMPKKLRGKEITIVFKAGRQDGGPGSDVQMDAFSGLGMHLAFVQTTLDPKTQSDPA